MSSDVDDVEAGNGFDSLFEEEVRPDWDAFWKGMPSYKQEDLAPFQTLLVHFASPEDRDNFSKLIGQRIGAKTPFVWHPKAEIMTAADKVWTAPKRPTRYPVYIISKGRWESRLTAKAFEWLQVPYHIVIEPQEYNQYAAVIDPRKILTLPFSNLGLGGIPARNWVWEHACKTGAARHWIFDDNISGFCRFHENNKVEVDSAALHCAIEDWCDRYENVVMAGFNYDYFAPRKKGHHYKPITLNTRVYSGILLSNKVPHRWRGRYNEDTDLSLRLLKDGYCTALFNAFLMYKTPTLMMKGGNTDELYKGFEAVQDAWEAHAKTCAACTRCLDGYGGNDHPCTVGVEMLSKDGRWLMAESLRQQHPDCTTVERKWRRWQHQVDYRAFMQDSINKLIPKSGIIITDGVNDYGMRMAPMAAHAPRINENAVVEDIVEVMQQEQPTPPASAPSPAAPSPASVQQPASRVSVLDFIGRQQPAPQPVPAPVILPAPKPSGQETSMSSGRPAPSPEPAPAILPEPAPAPAPVLAEQQPSPLVQTAPPTSVIEFLNRTQQAPTEYKPDPFPNLSGVRELIVNVESTGLRWWENDEAISATIGTLDGKHQWFLPWGFAGPGNLPREQVIKFLQDVLPNVSITNANTKFDVHMLRKAGVDLEAMGCKVSDVQHYAALLDDNRKKFNIDLLAEEFLGGVKVLRVDESRMATYTPAEVAARARYQVELVAQLREVFWPKLDAEDLQRVRKLEDEVIYPVCEMERNGAPLDIERLERWVKESQVIYESLLHELAGMLGRSVNPNAPTDMEKVFEHLKLPVTYLESGSPSFTDAILKRIQHPTIQKIRFALKLSDLRSRYLLKYQKCVGADGILRYALHQTRYQRDSGEEGGTGPGRFSSSELIDGVGANIQQVMKVTKQRKMFGYAEKDSSHDDEIFIIRALMIPQQTVSDYEVKWICADAEQIEYRVFGHYANNPRVIQAYKDEPRLNFHSLIEGYIKPYLPHMDYDGAKTLNFATIYGAAQVKQATMLGFITEAEGEDIKAKRAWNDPRLAAMKTVAAIYNRELREVKPLLKKAQDLAASRGFVKTLMGRRSRFEFDKRYHKALNNVIQGGSADYNKVKLVEVHKARDYTGLLLRFTVHDELDGDGRQPETLARVREVLDAQSWPDMRIPLLWDVKDGRNWAEAK
jgi:DNA polymerase I-like protein with 3'-5' exonuclease and polymerase domains